MNHEEWNTKEVQITRFNRVFIGTNDLYRTEP